MRVFATVLVLGISGCQSTARDDRMPPASAQTDAGRVEARALYRRGLDYAIGRNVAQDYATALVWFERAAERGHVGAQYMAGAAYHVGRGTQVDQPRAVEWFERAARAGHARAQYQLGDAYLNGRGAPREPSWAALWLGKSALQGNAAAQFDLGVANAAGLGVPMDEIQALRWLLLAQERGRDDAAPIIERIEARLSESERAQARALAARSETPLPPGSTTGFAHEPTVRYVQAGLSWLGYPSGLVDGIAGEKTLAAIATYRRARGMRSERIIDGALLARMRRDLAAIDPAAQP
jgi:hypothetical protein